MTNEKIKSLQGKLESAPKPAIYDIPPKQLKKLLKWMEEMVKDMAPKISRDDRKEFLKNEILQQAELIKAGAEIGEDGKPIITDEMIEKAIGNAKKELKNYISNITYEITGLELDNKLNHSYGEIEKSKVEFITQLKELLNENKSLHVKIISNDHWGSEKYQSIIIVYLNNEPILVNRDIHGDLMGISTLERDFNLHNYEHTKGELMKTTTTVNDTVYTTSEKISQVSYTVELKKDIEAQKDTLKLETTAKKFEILLKSRDKSLDDLTDDVKNKLLKALNNDDAGAGSLSTHSRVSGLDIKDNVAVYIKQSEFGGYMDIYDKKIELKTINEDSIREKEISNWDGYDRGRQLDEYRKFASYTTIDIVSIDKKNKILTIKLTGKNVPETVTYVSYGK